jgi:hypothetical protein
MKSTKVIHIKKSTSSPEFQHRKQGELIAMKRMKMIRIQSVSIANLVHIDERALERAKHGERKIPTFFGITVTLCKESQNVLDPVSFMIIRRPSDTIGRRTLTRFLQLNAQTVVCRLTASLSGIQ